MKNKIQKSLATIVMFVLVVSCFATVLQTINANPTPVAGNPSPKMDWKPEYVKLAATITPYDYDRGNAAGDKIPSNAHSADYAGIYFYWNDKQRDDGVLLVDPVVFKLFDGETFTVTAKTSNCYWGHKLSATDEFAYDEASGLYIYNVFKNCMYADKKGNLVKDDMKNINMIFIDGKYNDASFIIEKVWYDEKGCKITDEKQICELNDKLSFNSNYKLGKNTVEIKDFITASKGKSITVTEIIPAGYFEKFGASTQKITIKCTDNPTQVVTFNNQKKWAQIEIQKIWLDVEGTPITDTARLAELNADFEKKKKKAVIDKVYDVKEGPQTVAETGCTTGFSIVGDAEVEVTIKAGEKKTVTFTNQEDKPTGEISILKSVNGMPIIEWATGNGINDDLREKILSGMVFYLYEDGPDVQSRIKAKSEPEAIGEYDATEGKIVFNTLNFGRTVSDFQGWYWVDESFTTNEAAMYFQQFKPVRVYIGNNGATSVDNFDYTAFYTIINGHGKGGYYIDQLGYPGLNNQGDIFYIGVTNTNTGKEYVSFCANAGSKNFAGDNHLGCSGYLVGKSMKDTAYLSAFNYIIDNYGDLDDVRPITQTVIWALLGAIDVDSDAFAKTNLSDFDKAAVKDVMANYAGYTGKGTVVDVAYMVCENPQHTFEFCQPQIVPSYRSDTIDNKEWEDNKYEFRVVTSTNERTDRNSWNLGIEVKEEHPLGSGVDVKDVWNDNLLTFDANKILSELLSAMQAVVDTAGAGKLTWTWNIETNEQTAGNRDGDTWDTFERQFYVGNTIVDDAAWIYFGADDAVIIEINGEVVAWSINVLGDNPADLKIIYPLGGFQSNLGRPGFTLYSVNLAEYLNTNANNNIKIYALNQDVAPSEPLSDASSDGNPCGILLTFEVRSYDGPNNPWE
jgi:hypothetical protein